MEKTESGRGYSSVERKLKYYKAVLREAGGEWSFGWHGRFEAMPAGMASAVIRRLGLVATSFDDGAFVDWAVAQ